MSVEIDQTFGKWTVLSEAAKRGKQRYWNCQCQCGRQKEVAQGSLFRGTSKSCGKCGERKHGMEGSPEWSSWSGMRQRCLSPTHHAYARYGGRGIGIDPRWDNFKQFYEDMGPRPQGTSLDRIDNSKGYSKDNCRWATHKQQSRNTSTNRLVEYKGQQYAVSELAELLGLKVTTVFRRLEKGTQIDRPLRKDGK